MKDNSFITYDMTHFATDIIWDNSNYEFTNFYIHKTTVSPSPFFKSLNKTVSKEPIYLKLPTHIQNCIKHYPSSFNLDQMIKSEFSNTNKDIKYKCALIGTILDTYGYNIKYAFSKSHCWLIINCRYIDFSLSSIPFLKSPDHTSQL